MDKEYDLNHLDDIKKRLPYFITIAQYVKRKCLTRLLKDCQFMDMWFISKELEIMKVKKANQYLMLMLL